MTLQYMEFDKNLTFEVDSVKMAADFDHKTGEWNGQNSKYSLEYILRKIGECGLVFTAKKPQKKALIPSAGPCRTGKISKLPELFERGQAYKRKSVNETLKTRESSCKNL